MVGDGLRNPGRVSACDPNQSGVIQCVRQSCRLDGGDRKKQDAGNPERSQGAAWVHSESGAHVFGLVSKVDVTSMICKWLGQFFGDKRSCGTPTKSAINGQKP